MQEDMRNRYQLVNVANAELVEGLAQLVRRGNELTAEVLAHLAELEERMLHLELGFASLFAYCVQALGMSEGGGGTTSGGVAHLPAFSRIICVDRSRRFALVRAVRVGTASRNRERD